MPPHSISSDTCPVDRFRMLTLRFRSHTVNMTHLFHQGLCIHRAFVVMFDLANKNEGRPISRAAFGLIG